MAAGTFNVTLSASNSTGTGTAILTLTLNAAPQISSALTATATRGSAFSYQINADSSPTSYNATGLPGGLSINTVLQRLAKKGWVSRQKERGVFLWQALISRDRAQALQAEDRLQQFLSIGSNPEVVAAFADRLDSASLDQLERLTAQIKLARQAREGGSCT